MKMCNHTNCKEFATHRITFSNKYCNGLNTCVQNLCYKHMESILIDGLAYRKQTEFRVESILPIDDIDVFKGYYDEEDGI